MESIHLAVEEYKRVVAEIKMHQTLVKTAIETIQKSKDKMAELAIRLEATQNHILDLQGKKEEDQENDRKED